MEKYQLLGETGHSYSGISDIVHNCEKEKINELLFQMDECYNNAISRQEELEKELDNIKTYRGMIVSDFVFMHKALKLGEKALSFVKDNQFTEILVLDIDKHRINYEKYPITVNVS